MNWFSSFISGRASCFANTKYSIIARLRSVLGFLGNLAFIFF